MNSTAQKKREKAKSKRFLYWIKGYIYMTASALAVIGLYLLYTAWALRNSTDWWLSYQDPLLGISNHAMLVIGGLLHLAVTVYLFVARDLTYRNLIIFWFGLNHLIYYAGLILIEPSALSNIERFFGWRLSLTPTTVGVRWKVFQACLIVVSVMFLLLIWHRSKCLWNEMWFKHWLETRIQQQNEKPNTSRKVEAVGDYTKNVCCYCDGKIAFTISRIGEEISCPHCGSRITLRQLPASIA